MGQQTKTFFYMQGSMTDRIYGIAEGVVLPGSGSIIAECWSVMSPKGESGHVDTSGIKVVDADEFREAVVGFIKQRLTESFWEDEIDSLEEKITGKKRVSSAPLTFFRKAVPLAERAATLELPMRLDFGTTGKGRCMFEVEFEAGCETTYYDWDNAQEKLEKIEHYLAELEKGL